MKKSMWTKQRDEFFVKRFNEFFSEWKKKDKKNTQGEFARQICKIRNQKTGEQCPVTNSYVSEWSRGKWFPDQYIPEIAEVLGVNEEDFYFQTDDEFYKLSSEYMTKLGRGEISQFCDEIGLDLRFLYIIRELIGSEFDSAFPTWTPLQRDPDPLRRDPDHLRDQIYIRSPLTFWSGSAEMDEDVRVLQHEVEVEEDGDQKRRLIPFSREDLRFLKDVQTDVMDYIEFLMMKRKKDQIREAEEASRRSRIPLKDGGIEVRDLSADALNQIDPYHDYNYKYTHEKDGE